MCRNEDLPGNTLGYAYVGGICRGQASVGMTEDGNKRFFGTITTITAHELGHILSMEHDTSKRWELKCSVTYFSVIWCKLVVIKHLEICAVLLSLQFQVLHNVFAAEFRQHTNHSACTI